MLKVTEEKPGIFSGNCTMSLAPLLANLTICCTGLDEELRVKDFIGELLFNYYQFIKTSFNVGCCTEED